MSDETTRGGTRRHVGRAVRKEIRIDASREAVWEAWAKPEEIARWFVDAAEGEMAPGETVTWIWERFGYRLPIEVYEAERGEYLAFGGRRPEGPPALQEVFVARDGGKTVLRLVNSGFLEGADWDEEIDGVDSGWELALATLARYLERYRGRDRWHLMEMRPVELFPYEAIVPLCTTRQGLEAWIGGTARPSVEPLERGGSVTLDLGGDLRGQGGGFRLDGEVLAAAPHEVLLSWPEVEGVLGLKAFRAGPGRAVALDWSSWAGEPPTSEIGSWLAAAADRLAAAVKGSSAHDAS